MAVGPHALGLLHLSPVIELLGTIGLVYLMFVAGLEIDLRQLSRARDKPMTFGAVTFVIPFLGVTGLGRRSVSAGPVRCCWEPRSHRTH